MTLDSLGLGWSVGAVQCGIALALDLWHFHSKGDDALGVSMAEHGVE